MKIIKIQDKNTRKKIKMKIKDFIFFLPARDWQWSQQ
jgi:hypothetical protein